MIFRVGQKVVCIKAHPEWVRACCAVPLVGRTYTVRGIDDTGGLLLEEIVNRHHPFAFDISTGRLSPGEASFYVDRFRPVVERKTDIAIFTEMLGPQRVLSLTTGNQTK